MTDMAAGALGLLSAQDTVAGWFGDPSASAVFESAAMVVDEGLDELGVVVVHGCSPSGQSRFDRWSGVRTVGVGRRSARIISASPSVVRRDAAELW
jgi:hypothetical protein